MSDAPDNHGLGKAPLGKTSDYVQQYNGDLLFPLSRKHKRVEIEIDPVNLPFYGYDEWNAYEVSWLNARGVPQVAIARFYIDCGSECIIESKSFKLYLNSFNQTQFESWQAVEAALVADITAATNGEVIVRLHTLNQARLTKLVAWEGVCLDQLDVTCTEYQVDASLLQADSHEVCEEELYSDLLKSNCLVTGQPDWGSIRVCYSGQAINRESLLRYIVSFRNHNEFHEQCVERVFTDIMAACCPDKLLVEARYTRRGGLDINPLRSTDQVVDITESVRLVRQ
jgi:7-cyano-7-deazaguanine reductase